MNKTYIYAILESIIILAKNVLPLLVIQSHKDAIDIVINRITEMQGQLIGNIPIICPALTKIRESQTTEIPINENPKKPYIEIEEITNFKNPKTAILKNAINDLPIFIRNLKLYPETIPFITMCALNPQTETASHLEESLHDYTLSKSIINKDNRLTIEFNSSNAKAVIALIKDDLIRIDEISQIDKVTIYPFYPILSQKDSQSFLKAIM